MPAACMHGSIGLSADEGMEGLALRWQAAPIGLRAGAKEALVDLRRGRVQRDELLAAEAQAVAQCSQGRLRPPASMPMSMHAAATPQVDRVGLDWRV